MKVNRLIIICFAVILCETAFAQIPSVQIPRPASLGGYNNNSYSNSSPSPKLPASPADHYIRQQQMHQQNVMEVNRRTEMLHQEIREAFESQYIKEETANGLIQNGFPSRQGTPGTEYFHSALAELQAMLTNQLPIDLCKAVYLIENAFYGGTENYKDFQNKIDEKAQLCRYRLSELKLNPKDNMALNMVIYSLLCDTLTIKQPGTEKNITHYPLIYNLDDYKSEKDYTSHFVTTLMKTNRGQCYSMPLFYMLIAEKLGAEAYISYAPHHSFIKIQDDKGAWYNLELTCRHILSDSHYMNHNYIKSEAIRNKIYLHPLTQKELISSLVAQLATYYLIRYGYDPYIIQCTDLVLQYYPTCSQALLLNSSYQTRLTLEIAQLLEAPNPAVLKEKSPEAYKHFEKMHQTYRDLDNTGYEDTPPEIYERWHNHVLSEKEKQQGTMPTLQKKIR